MLSVSNIKLTEGVVRRARSTHTARQRDHSQRPETILLMELVASDQEGNLLACATDAVANHANSQSAANKSCCLLLPELGASTARLSLLVHLMWEPLGPGEGYQTMAGGSVELLECCDSTRWLDEPASSCPCSVTLTAPDCLSGIYPTDADNIVVGRVTCSLSVDNNGSLGSARCQPLDWDYIGETQRLLHCDKQSIFPEMRQRAIESFQRLHYEGLQGNTRHNEMERYTEPSCRKFLPGDYTYIAHTRCHCIDAGTVCNIALLGCYLCNISVQDYCAMAEQDPCRCFEGPYRAGIVAMVNGIKYQTDYDALGRNGERFSSMLNAVDALVRAGYSNGDVVGDCEDTAFYGMDIHNAIRQADVNAASGLDADLARMYTCSITVANGYVAVPQACICTTAAPHMASGFEDCTHTTCVMWPIGLYRQCFGNPPDPAGSYTQASHTTPAKLVLFEGTAILLDGSCGVCTRPSPNQADAQLLLQKRLMHSQTESSPISDLSGKSRFYKFATQINSPNGAFYVKYAGKYAMHFAEYLKSPTMAEFTPMYDNNDPCCYSPAMISAVKRRAVTQIPMSALRGNLDETLYNCVRRLNPKRPRKWRGVLRGRNALSTGQQCLQPSAPVWGKRSNAQLNTNSQTHPVNMKLESFQLSRGVSVVIYQL